jgi:hypothetical protein
MMKLSRKLLTLWSRQCLTHQASLGRWQYRCLRLPRYSFRYGCNRRCFLPNVSTGMYFYWGRYSLWFRLFLSHLFHRDEGALEIDYLWTFRVYLNIIFHSQYKHLSHLPEESGFLILQYLKKFNHINHLLLFI